MVDIINVYKKLCFDHQVPFKVSSSILSYDESTLFCPAGMQQYKNSFKDFSVSGLTIANVQSCLRINDIDEIGKDSHLGYFNMIGLFSFRHWTVEATIDFFLEFMDLLEIKVDYVTIHPDRSEWRNYYPIKDVRLDMECTWTDGEIKGYCTEFYHKGVEIGNIVNPLDSCIDVGFGLERLDAIVNKRPEKTKNDLLIETIKKIIDSGVEPGPNKHGYVLRRLLRLLYLNGGSMDHKYFLLEKTRQINMKSRYEKLKEKHADKDAAWWFDTHGIDLESCLSG